METLMNLFVYALSGAVGLASFEIVGLWFLRDIPIGEDFYRGGQGYAEYVRYWSHISRRVVVGGALGLVVRWISS